MDNPVLPAPPAMSAAPRSAWRTTACRPSCRLRVFAPWTTAAVGAGPAAQAAAEGIQGIGRSDTALEPGDPNVVAPMIQGQHRPGIPGEAIEMNEPTRRLIDAPLQEV